MPFYKLPQQGTEAPRVYERVPPLGMRWMSLYAEFGERTFFSSILLLKQLKQTKMFQLAFPAFLQLPICPTTLGIGLGVLLILGHMIRMISDGYKAMMKHWCRWILWSSTVIFAFWLVIGVIYPIYCSLLEVYVHSSPIIFPNLQHSLLNWYNKSPYIHYAISLCFLIAYGELRARVVQNYASGAVTRDHTAPNCDLSVNISTLKEITTIISSMVQPPTSAPTPPTETLKEIIAEQLNRLLPPHLLTLPSANFTAELTETVLAEVEDVKSCIKALAASVNSIQATSTQPPQPQPTPPALTTKTPLPRKSEKHPVSFVDDASESSDESGEEETWVQVVRGSRNSPYKASTGPRSIPLPKRTSSPAHPVNLSDPIDHKMSEEALLAALKQREAVRKSQQREANQESEFLTAEERLMSLDELHRKFKLENQRRFNEAAELRRMDFEPLGQLTEQQAMLPRYAIKRLIRQKKHEAWVKDMQARGIPLFRCDVCHELTNESHKCIATRWLTSGSRNSAISKGVVISTGSSGVRVHTAPIINTTKLQKEYDDIVGWKEKIDGLDNQAAPRKSEPHTDSATSQLEPEQGGGDVAMGSDEAGQGV